MHFRSVMRDLLISIVSRWIYLSMLPKRESHSLPAKSTKYIFEVYVG